MVRGARPGEEIKKKKPTIGDAEFRSLSKERQQRIRDLASDKPLSEIFVQRKKKVKTGERTELKSRKETKEKGGFVSNILGKTGPFAKLREEGRLHATPVSIAPVGAVAASVFNLFRKRTQAAEVSRLGLTKLSGTAANIQRGKLVAIPGRDTVSFGKGAVLKNAFKTNPKSSGLTKKLMIGAGFSLAGASIAKDLFGTYPFASFGKEETLQSQQFVFNQAIQNGLFEEAQQILDASNEIVNDLPGLTEKIPYANVQKEFQRYIIEQGKNNKVWQKIIDKKLSEVGQETDFAQQRRESDEVATQRKLEQQALDSEYFQLIRDGKFEEAEELLRSRLGE